MNNTEDKKFLLRLQYSLCNPRLLNRLSNFLQTEGSVEDLRLMKEEEFQACFEASRKTLLERGGSVADPEAEMKLSEQHQIKIITFSEENYQASLKTISDPPLALYVKGELPVTCDQCLAVVGTRRPSFYGIETAKRLTRELSSFGIAIVSGLARGIDTCAHEGTLESDGKTYGVLGSGLLEPYPLQNKRLMERIEREGGALISELPLRSEPLAFHFPLRNRIISGLARGVCVVEASDKSGSLITAQLALEQGREVYAVPGMIQSLTSQGTLRLIQEGAKLVRRSTDILEDYLPWLEGPVAEWLQMAGTKSEKD